jgi:transcriptional regulator with XRE-family HTH domain
LTPDSADVQTVAVPDDEELYVAFGKRLKELRTEKQLSQTALAGLVQISRTSLINIEQGGQGVPLRLLLALAVAFGVELDELVPAELRDHVGHEMLRKVAPKDREWVRLVVGGTQFAG